MDKILVCGTIEILEIAIAEYGADRVWWQTSPINERKGIRVGMLRGRLIPLDSTIDEGQWSSIVSEVPDWITPQIEEGVSDEEE